MNYTKTDFFDNENIVAGYTLSGDGMWHFDRSDDMKNYVQLAGMLGIDEKHIVRVHQKHTDKVFVVDEKYLFDAGSKDFYGEPCDGMIANQKGLALGIVTADCVPVYLYDSRKNVIGMVHSGREGTLRGIANNAVLKMKEEYGTDPAYVKCCLGPYICAECYELEEKFIDDFRDYYSDDECGMIFSDTANGKTHLNLGMAIKLGLMHIGVRAENICSDAPCTCHNKEFYSWRRTKDPERRILSFMMLK